MKSVAAGFCLVTLFALASPGQAEIYKWVDANGRTHYSERKEDARAVEVKVRAGPAAQGGAAAGRSWEEKEIEFRQRQAQKQLDAQRSAPPTRKPPKSLSGGRADDADASRCTLARDIVNGALRHGNGNPIDQYDLDIAQNDIRRYCH